MEKSIQFTEFEPTKFATHFINACSKNEGSNCKLCYAHDHSTDLCPFKDAQGYQINCIVKMSISRTLENHAQTSISKFVDTGGATKPTSAGAAGAPYLNWNVSTMAPVSDAIGIGRNIQYWYDNLCDYLDKSFAYQILQQVHKGFSIGYKGMKRSNQNIGLQH